MSPSDVTQAVAPERKALNLLSLLGDAARRTQTPIKTLYPYFNLPGMLSLAAGQPHPHTFAIRSLTVTVPSLDDDGPTEVPLTIPFEPATGATPAEASVAVARSMQYGTTRGISGYQAFARAHTAALHHPPYADWDVIATVGNTDGLAKCLGLIGSGGDSLLLDEWTYPAAVDTATSHNISTVPIRMDRDGMCPTDLERVLTTWPADRPRPKMMYLVPTGQNPTGVTMPIERRRAIYALAQRFNVMIFEDDPYYYLQYAAYQPPAERRTPLTAGDQPGLSGLIPSFLALDVDGRVIRLDSFSKTLGPGFRTGWLTASKQFLPYVEYHHETTTQQPAGPAQAIVTELLTRHWGHDGFARYLRRLQHGYYERRNRFLDTVSRHLDGLVDYVVPDAGMFVWFRLRLPAGVTGADDQPMQSLLQGLVAAKVIAIPGYLFAGQIDRAARSNEPYLRAAFSITNPDDFEPAVERLAGVLRAMGCGSGALST
ncbi:hypothetical protein IWQ60_006400 [Tieghemiomyces parasiticus]|uniref:Aminotransferase class I/classII large domain-containing protein n=1 Tax=Tieghemiomyces parasiticus TaxID=78921 RepID=A0A9W8DXD3_9FUNG|nr:hypothetical protein IWQ60_006400 [Tieghemiomyces parasiticus]